MNRKIGWAMALFASLAYSTNSPIARGVILEGMAPLTLLAGRFTIAAALLGLTVGTTKLGQANGEQRPLDRRGLLIALASGVLNGLTLSLFYLALARLTASVASMLGVATYTVFALLILMLGGEALTGRKLTRLLLGLAGLYLLIGPGGAVDGWGIALVTLGSFLFSVHMVSVQWYLKPYNTWALTALMVSAAAAAVLILWAAGGMDTFVPGVNGWLAIAFQAIIATYIGRLITYAAVNIIGAGQFALLSPLETLLAIIWSVLFLNESLSILQWAGAILILSSVALAGEKLRWRRVKASLN